MKSTSISLLIDYHGRTFNLETYPKLKLPEGCTLTLPPSKKREQRADVGADEQKAVFMMGNAMRINAKDVVIAPRTMGRHPNLRKTAMEECVADHGTCVRSLKRESAEKD